MQYTLFDRFKLPLILFVIIYALFGYFPEKLYLESDCAEFILGEKEYINKKVIVDGYIMKSLLRHNYFSYSIQIGDEKKPIIDSNLVIASMHKIGNGGTLSKNTIIKRKHIEGRYGIYNEIFYSFIDFHYWNRSNDKYIFDRSGKFYIDREKNIFYFLYNTPDLSPTDKLKLVVTGSNLEEAEENAKYIISIFD